VVHSVHAITRSLSPLPRPPALAPTDFPIRSTGLEVLESTHFRITCFQAATGVKFLLFTDPPQPNVDVMLRKIYELYSDYVMKNPFYTIEMPIRCEKFDRGLDGYLRIAARG
jgi:trafficking protein particle complex subunit 4